MNDVMMEYKGYTALAQYSNEDGCFIGKVIGITDQIVFDGSSLDEIRKTFESDVDSYIQYCRQKGREPNKPTSEPFFSRAYLCVPLYSESRSISRNEMPHIATVAKIIYNINLLSIFSRSTSYLFDDMLIGTANAIFECFSERIGTFDHSLEIVQKSYKNMSKLQTIEDKELPYWSALVVLTEDESFFETPNIKAFLQTDAKDKLKSIYESICISMQDNILYTGG